jgi:hypothetical protein
VSIGTKAPKHQRQPKEAEGQIPRNQQKQTSGGLFSRPGKMFLKDRAGQRSSAPSSAYDGSLKDLKDLKMHWTFTVPSLGFDA